MTHPPARASHEEMQQRKEMLVNYLQSVLRPDDIRLQALIADLREDLRQQATARLQSGINTPQNSPTH